MTERRYRRRNDPFRKTLVVDIRHVENFEAIRAVGSVEIFAAQRQIENLFCMVMMRFLEHAPIRFVHFEIVRIRKLMQMTAHGGLRFLRLSPDDAVQTARAGTDPGITPEEIHGAISEPEQLRHNCVVVVLF